MEILILKFCNAFGENCDDAVQAFLMWRGRPMHSSQIGCRIGTCWGKVFGRDTATGGVPAFCKAAVSAVNQDDESKRNDLASLMVHHKATDDQYYLLEAKATAAVRTSKT